MDCWKFRSKPTVHQDNYEPNVVQKCYQYPDEVLTGILRLCQTQDEFLRLRLVCHQWHFCLKWSVKLRLTIFDQHTRTVTVSYLSDSYNDRNRFSIDFTEFAQSDLTEMVDEIVIGGSTISKLPGLLNLINTSRVRKVTIKTSSIREINDSFAQIISDPRIYFKELHIETVCLKVDALDLLESFYKNHRDHLEITISVHDIFTSEPTRVSNLVVGELVSDVSLFSAVKGFEPYLWLSNTFPRITTLNLNLSQTFPNANLLYLMGNLSCLHLTVNKYVSIPNSVNVTRAVPSVRKLVMTDLTQSSILANYIATVQSCPNIEQFEFQTANGLERFTSVLFGCWNCFSKLKVLKLTVGCSSRFEFSYLMCLVSNNCQNLRMIAIETNFDGSKISTSNLVSSTLSYLPSSLVSFSLVHNSVITGKTHLKNLFKEIRLTIAICMNSNAKIDYKFGFYTTTRSKNHLESLMKLPNFKSLTTADGKSKFYFCEYNHGTLRTGSVLITVNYNNRKNDIMCH